MSKNRKEKKNPFHLNIIQSKIEIAEKKGCVLVMMMVKETNRTTYRNTKMCFGR